MDISVKECWWDPQGAPTGKIDRDWNRLKQGFIGSIAFRNEAMICRLFVLTVLWDRSKTDHLTQRGATSLRTEIDQPPHWDAPYFYRRRPQVPWLRILVGLLTCLCPSSVLSSLSERRNRK